MTKLFQSVLLGAVAGLLVGGAAIAQPVTISTLPPGAINNVQAQVIAKAVQQHSDLQMRVATFNSPSAILGSANAGQTDFAFTSNDESGAAVNGIATYKGRPMTKLKVALSVFPFAVGIMVKKDSDIKTVADLKGRKLPTGWQGFPQGIALFNALLATAGLSLDDADPVPATNLLRAADDFKAGKTVGTMFAIGAPKVAEIDSAVGGVRFLSLDDTPEALARMQAIRPQYHIAVRNPAPPFAGVIGPTNLMEYYIVVMAGTHVPDKTVYEFVKALHGARADLVKGHPSYNAFSPKKIADQHIGLEYHPGSIKFFKEVGLWKGN
jgi:TRAP transporter TAXI family solute receptor